MASCDVDIAYVTLCRHHMLLLRAQSKGQPTWAVSTQRRNTRECGSAIPKGPPAYHYYLGTPTKYVKYEFCNFLKLKNIFVHLMHQLNLNTFSLFVLKTSALCKTLQLHN